MVPGITNHHGKISIEPYTEVSGFIIKVDLHRAHVMLDELGDLDMTKHHALYDLYSWMKTAVREAS